MARTPVTLGTWQGSAQLPRKESGLLGGSRGRSGKLRAGPLPHGVGGCADAPQLPMEGVRHGDRTVVVLMERASRQTHEALLEAYPIVLHREEQQFGAGRSLP